MTGVGLSIVNFLKSFADRIGGNEQSISCQDADQTLIRIILFAMQCRSGNFGGPEFFSDVLQANALNPASIWRRRVRRSFRSLTGRQINTHAGRAGFDADMPRSADSRLGHVPTSKPRDFHHAR
jgi:membrane protease subunit (stomatin/prohibitin family)